MGCSHMQYPKAVDFPASVRYCEHMSSEDFGTRLRRIRETKGMTLRELSRRTGIGLSTLHQWETGKRWAGKAPPGDDVQRLAQELDATVDHLLGKADVPLPRRPLTDDELLDKIGARPYDPIELIEGVAASAGPGAGIPQDIDDTLPRRKRRRRYDRLREITVTGRCMEPELCPGDLEIIDREQVPRPGRIVIAVRDEEELLIKRLVVRNGSQRLISNDGQEIVIDERIRVLGPVVAFQRGLR